MINTIKHLLPNAKAWRITIDKPLRRFMVGLANALMEPRDAIDSVFNNIDPYKTKNLNEWEEAFALRDSGLTEEQRRSRLDGEWKAFGGQDPFYIQETLQNAGFNVYLHEWWEPETDPPIARDPFQYLWDGSSPRQQIMGAGHNKATSGGSLAFAGSTNAPPGYPLVNKVFTAVQAPIGAGHNRMVSGGASAISGASVTSFRRKQYVLPNEESTKFFVFYIGGQTFPQQAIIPASRRDELEDLCLKLCPSEQWIGMLITYL